MFIHKYSHVHSLRTSAALRSEPVATRAKRGSLGSQLRIVGIMIMEMDGLHIFTGWWLGHLSEKYERQLGWLFPTEWENKNCSKPPTSLDTSSVSDYWMSNHLISLQWWWLWWLWWLWRLRWLWRLWRRWWWSLLLLLLFFTVEAWDSGFFVFLGFKAFSEAIWSTREMSHTISIKTKTRGFPGSLFSNHEALTGNPHIRGEKTKFGGA